jgi:hypothetical protein
MQDIMARRQGMLSGLSGQEMEAARGKALQGINQGTQSNMRALRAMQAQSGLRGSTAAQQQSQALAGGLQQRRQLEQDLLLQDRAAKESALNQYEQTTSGVKQFDLQQAAAEKMGIVGAGLGMAQIGGAERAGSQAAQAAAMAGQPSKPGIFESILGMF